MNILISIIFYDFILQKNKINLKFLWKNKISFKKTNKNLIFNFFKIYYLIHNLNKNKNKSNIRRLTMTVNNNVIWSDILSKKNKYDKLNFSIYNIYYILLNNINSLY